jgi:hypothetical protein
MMATEEKATGAGESAVPGIIYCPYCKAPVGETCVHKGMPALRFGGVVVRGFIRGYCVVCRKGRHYGPKGADRGKA